MNDNLKFCKQFQRIYIKNASDITWTFAKTQEITCSDGKNNSNLILCCWGYVHSNQEFIKDTYLFLLLS